MLRIYMIVKKTTVLGPYERYVVWVQGCKKRCMGCVSHGSQTLDGGYEMDVSSLADDILSTQNIEGITISGGEPFLQSTELVALLTKVKLKKDLGVILYTGMMYEEIKDNILTKHCDIIIDGEYQEQLNDGLSLRGSSNQNIIALTQRYDEYIDMFGSTERKIELLYNANEIVTVGIPDPITLSTLNAMYSIRKEI